MIAVTDGLNAVLAGNAFANAFWVFVGIVAGACIQFALGLLTVRSQRRNAQRALHTEIELNLAQVKVLQGRITYLKERISAGQIQEEDLFISMQGFDYSIVNPLVMSGHFHVMLGHERVVKYFNFMRFFSNQNASTVNSMLRTEHEKAKSLDYLAYLDAKIREVAKGLTEVQQSIQRPKNA